MKPMQSKMVRALLGALFVSAGFAAHAAGMLPESTVVLINEADGEASMVVTNTDASPSLLYSKIEAVEEDAKRMGHPFACANEKAAFTRGGLFFRPDTLRWELAYACSNPPEYRAGFLDGIGAFVSMVLEGCQIDPETWEVLAAVERAGESQ